MHFIVLLLIAIVLAPRALAIVAVALDAWGLFLLKTVGILLFLLVVAFVYEEAIDKPNGVLRSTYSRGHY